ncbi:MAG: hypothetical protein WKH68_11715 [Candidatus Limnocylindria bacterium]
MVPSSSNTAEKTDPNSLRPGGHLVDLILAAQNDGRPVWQLEDVVIPRLKQVAYGPQQRGDYALVTPAEEAWNARGRPFLRPQLAAVLDCQSVDSFQQLLAKPSARIQARHLSAAAFHDVLGWPLAGKPGVPFTETIAHHLGLDGGRRSASQAVESGRELWRKLAAWPWWPLGRLGYIRGPLPEEWWMLPYVSANFDAWRDPQAFVLAQSKVRWPSPDRNAA